MNDMFRPLEFMGRCLFVIGVALFLTLIIPGFVANSGDVFYRQGIINKLQKTEQDKLNAYESQQEQRRKQIEQMDLYLTSTPQTEISPERLSSLIQLRAFIKGEYDAAKPPISVIAFHLNSQILLWPGLYATLGCLALLLRPHTSSAKFSKVFPKIIIYAAGIYVFYQWPLWMRNFVLSNEGRTIFAFSNYDIHRLSFFTQEAVILGFCFLVSTIWRQWAQFFNERQKELTKEASDPVARALDNDASERLSKTFMWWQICSVVLAAGFLFATNFYWTIVERYNDPRYLFSAIIVHLLWGLTWILLSLPLAITWVTWERNRVRALESLLLRRKDISLEKYEHTRQLLTELRPLGSINVSLSAIGAITSFLLPLLNLIKP